MSVLFVCMLTVLFKEQQIARNRRVKQPLDLREVARLRKIHISLVTTASAVIV